MQRLVLHLVWVFSAMGSLRNVLNATNIPASEMNALYDLYNATDGLHWYWDESSSAGIAWNFTPLSYNNPCVDNWQGIECSLMSPFELYHVVSIALPFYNLKGRLPSSLDALPQLQYLDVSGNELVGSIPASIGNLTRLQTLDLDTNQLTGSIPESFGNLQNLINLFLYTNELSGTIPSSLGNCSPLLYFDVATNLLSGTIPTSLANLTQVGFLYLFENELTGTIPQSFGNLLQMQELALVDNQLTGVIPESFGSLLQLQKLELDTNKLTGTIPESLSNLTQLVYLYLYFNQLTGTIPSSLGNLNQMQKLELYSNQFTGPIPATFGNLSKMVYLLLYTNQLTGTIPGSLGSLVKLLYLEIHDNILTGTIPGQLSGLSKLQKLELNANKLHGTIPSWLGNLVILQKLELDSNRLTSTIPASLQYLTQLQYLHLGTNQLTSTIPTWLSHLTQLIDLNLGGNLLTGTVPESLGSLVHLQYLHFGDNQLRGTIPDYLGSQLNLLDLQLASNRLTGSIPNSLGNFIQLQYMFLYSNQLTGTIPATFGNLTSMLGLSLDSNQLTGTFPQSVANLNQVLYFHLSGNHLTGTIPNVVSKYLQQLQLSDNKLEGRVPSLSRLFALQVVLLQNNHLTGTLDSVFDPTKQLQVASIVLNNNQLSGTIPSDVFELKPETFVGTSNCFEGPLPIADICSNQKLVSFVIDGMSSASSCRNKLFVGSLSAYTLLHAIGGNIPACLFQLPHLTTLHLSGNGFTGSIPSDIVLSDTLTDLSISHNALTGNIPEQVQFRKWGNIDVSYNRLSGTLSSGFTSTGTIALEDNRISGELPASFHTMKNISVLGSNTFSCSYDETDLPQHDPNRKRYHCGSNSFDVLYYIWLSFAVCTAVVVAYCAQKYNFCRNILQVDNILFSSKLYNSLTFICRLSGRCCLYTVIVLLPLYSICSVYYGTQTYTYAYQVSAVYMSGVVPFALNWCFWLLLVLLVLFTVLSFSSTSVDTGLSLPVEAFTWKSFCFTFLPYIMIDCIVVVGVNAAYVYVAVYKSSSLLLVVQTLLSIFKVVWGRWALPYVWTKLTQHEKIKKIQVVNQIVVNILNNIIIPCLVVAVVSPNCFYNALVRAPTVSATVEYKDCSTVDVSTGLCLEYAYISVPTSFDPPFTYNYQCSSSLITYYAPAYVSMCIVSTFVSPLAQYICQWLLARATVGTYWYSLLSRSLPRLLKPVGDSLDAGNFRNSFVGSGSLMTTLISTLGLVLTFGIMFPPLCVALAGSMLATVLLFHVNLSKFLKSAAQQHRNVIAEMIQRECDSVDSMQILRDSVWVLITVSCWFYTLFLFDTLGDAVGFEGAYWVLIVMPLMPLVMYIAHIIVYKYFVHTQSENANEQQHQNTGEIEMQSKSDDVSVVHNVLVAHVDRNGIA